MYNDTKPEDIDLSSAWARVAGALVSPETTQQQRTLLRAVFYAGVMESVLILESLSKLPKNEAAKFITGLVKEGNLVIRKSLDARFSATTGLYGN